MTDIDDLKNRYFVTSSDAQPPSEPVPATYADSKVTPLIDGQAYNDALNLALGNVSQVPTADRPFVFITGWVFGLSGTEPPYALDLPDTDLPLLGVLKALAREGCDVRVLSWLCATVYDSDFAGRMLERYREQNEMVMRSISELRDEPAIGAKAVLDVIGHTAGSLHSKTVVIGSDQGAVGFTGGIDFVASRWGTPRHEDIPDWQQVPWHDITAQVEGPAVQGLYDNFADLWNENITRPVLEFRLGGPDEPSAQLPDPGGGTSSPLVFSVDGGPMDGRVRTRIGPDDPTDLSLGLAQRDVTGPGNGPAGSHHVQNLRTIPQFNYDPVAFAGPEREPITFAQEGCFEYRSAYEKALKGAESYIYIEDQCHWSSEIYGWINEALKADSGLRVILLMAGSADPDDPDLPGEGFLRAAINDTLLSGLSDAQRGRVGVFRHMGDGGLVVHSKTVLVDDHWAAIGSANIAQRSLYTDIEHGVSFIDEDGTVVARYRAQLWADHFRHEEPDDFLDLDAALHAWNEDWGTDGDAPARPDALESVPLPLDVSSGNTLFDNPYTRSIVDFDSRQRWSIGW